MMTWWTTAVGLTHTEITSLTAADVAAYTELTGDTAGDGVPVGLLGGVISKILGMDVPGPGTNYLKQSLQITTPARLGETLTVRVEVDKVTPDKRLVYLTTTCRGSDGRTVATGRALVLAGGVAEHSPDIETARTPRPTTTRSER